VTNLLSIDSETPLPHDAGGKAKGLQLIARAGLRIPPAWVVLPAGCESTIADLVARLRGTGDRLLAVRSSAPEEDDEQASFAGIHQSRLGVRVAELGDAINEVAASSLSDRARSYREQMGLPPPSAPCAVVVQELIRSEVAGVAFSVGDGGDEVIIEAVEGLGETVVEGSVVPETHVMRRAGEGWRTQRRSPRTQSVAVAVRDGRVSRVPLPRHRQHADVLDDGQAVAIAEGIGLLQRVSGRPLDIEWAWADGTLWFLQARPRTRPLGDEVYPGQIWTRANVRDVLPEIPSAYARSTVVDAFGEGERYALRKCGVRLDPSIPLLTFVHGRPVFNEHVFAGADLLGMPREAMQADFGGSQHADDTVRSVDIRKLLSHPVVLFRSAWFVQLAPRRAGAFIARARAIRRELDALDMRAADSVLVHGVRSYGPMLGRGMVQNAVGVAAAVSNAQWLVLTRLREHPAPRAALSRLVADGEPSISTRQVDDLVHLAEAIRAWGGAAEFTGDVTPEHASPGFWRDHFPGEVWSMVRHWLDLYGHRGPYESDLASPRYADDLRLLARALFPLVRRDTPTLSSIRDERSVAAEAAWREVERIVGRRGRWGVERAVRRLKRLLALRESLRSEVVAAAAPLRRMVLELGRRLVEQGRLGSGHDVWHLSVAELERAFTQPGFLVDVAVAREHSRRVAWRRIEVPNRLRSEDVASLASRSRAMDHGSSVLRGNGVSPGVVEGEACVLREPMEANRFPTGAVLVAPATDPGWTPLFARAVAVVVEVGGALSHAGIVAREFGVPCVANIDGVTRLLRDGDRIRIDGSAGRVTVISRAPQPSTPSRQ
jgi:phosphohistidine swiveling domain-containing protein